MTAPRSKAPPRVALLVPAAGSGRRMGGARKPFLALGEGTVLEAALSRFLRLPGLVEAVVAAPAEFLREARDGAACDGVVVPDGEAHDGLARDGEAREGLLRDGEARNELARLEGLDERVRVVEGGASRFESVARAFAAARADADVVAVHDGARPFPPDEAIRRCVEVAAAGEVAVAGIPVADTLKRAGPSGRDAKTVSRDGLWRAQTPQMFPRGVFAEAVARCRASGAQPTDDSWMAEAMGESVRMVRSSPANLKITSADDLRLAERLLRSGLSRASDAGGRGP